MITIVVNNEKLISTKGHNGRQYIEVYGLSTDVVHNADGTVSIPGVPQPYNAMPFYEMDMTLADGIKINKIYLYDAENQTWLPQQ